MAQINITYKAFKDVAREGTEGITTASFNLDGVWNQVSNNLLMDSIYKATNLQEELSEFGAASVEIELWNTIKNALPSNRTHTSLSVGDEIQINRSYAAIGNQDGPTYRIADIGFELVGA
jgi:hypothetical protein